MSCGEEKPPWNVFEGVNKISTAPEALMAEIDSAITALEYSRASDFLQSPPPISNTKNNQIKLDTFYDAQLADEAYNAGLASMAEGKLDEAVFALNLALSKCPPERTSAVAKIQSRLSAASEKLKKSSKYNT